MFPRGHPVWPKSPPALSWRAHMPIYGMQIPWMWVPRGLSQFGGQRRGRTARPVPFGMQQEERVGMGPCGRRLSWIGGPAPGSLPVGHHTAGRDGGSLPRIRGPRHSSLVPSGASGSLPIRVGQAGHFCRRLDPRGPAGPAALCPPAAPPHRGRRDQGQSPRLLHTPMLVFHLGAWLKPPARNSSRPSLSCLGFAFCGWVRRPLSTPAMSQRRSSLSSATSPSSRVGTGDRWPSTRVCGRISQVPGCVGAVAL